MTRANPDNRENDERVLAMVAMRSAGHTATQVARAFGITPSRASAITNAVRNADALQSREQVAGAYW